MGTNQCMETKRRHMCVQAATGLPEMAAETAQDMALLC